MGEVIHYDFGGDGGITDRHLDWPEVPEQAHLLEQAKNIQAAILLTDESTPTEIVDRLTANLDRCLNALQPRDSLIDEINSDAAKKADELRKEII